MIATVGYTCSCASRHRVGTGVGYRSSRAAQSATLLAIAPAGRQQCGQVEEGPADGVLARRERFRSATNPGTRVARACLNHVDADDDCSVRPGVFLPKHGDRHSFHERQCKECSASPSTYLRAVEVPLMAWGAISYNSRSPLVFINETLTACRYVDDILALPFVETVPDAMFQQESARSLSPDSVDVVLTTCPGHPCPRIRRGSKAFATR